MMMNFDTKTAADYAGQNLDKLLARAVRDSVAVVETSNIPAVVTYFDELREIVRELSIKITALQKHVDTLSQETIPTMFVNQDVKSIRVDNVGRVSINIRWSASMPDKETGLGWLRQTGNEGLIIETVNAQTLGAFAKEETMAGRPLPDEIFKISATPYTSITKG